MEQTVQEQSRPLRVVNTGTIAYLPRPRRPLPLHSSQQLWFQGSELAQQSVQPQSVLQAIPRPEVMIWISSTGATVLARSCTEASVTVALAMSTREPAAFLAEAVRHRGAPQLVQQPQPQQPQASAPPELPCEEQA